MSFSYGQGPLHNLSQQLYTVIPISSRAYPLETVLSRNRQSSPGGCLQHISSTALDYQVIPGQQLRKGCTPATWVPVQDIKWVDPKTLSS